MRPLPQRRDAPPTRRAARGVRRGRDRLGLPLTARVLARRDPGSTVDVLGPSKYKPRVDGPTVHQNLIVQVRSRRMPGRADQAYLGALLDRLSSYHVRLGEMSIEGTDLMTVIDDNRPAVAAAPSDEGDGAARWRANKCAPAGADVYADVKSRPGWARRAEDGTDRAVHRPSEPQRRSVSSRPSGRVRCPGAVRWVAAPAMLSPPATSRPSRAETPAASAPTTRLTVTGITDQTAKQRIFNRAVLLNCRSLCVRTTNACPYGSSRGFRALSCECRRNASVEMSRRPGT